MPACPGPGRPWWLYLDNVGALFGEQHRRVGPPMLCVKSSTRVPSKAPGLLMGIHLEEVLELVQPHDSTLLTVAKPADTVQVR
jgi:hypothetical protein